MWEDIKQAWHDFWGPSQAQQAQQPQHEPSPEEQARDLEQQTHTLCPWIPMPEHPTPARAGLDYGACMGTLKELTPHGDTYN
jgi:hypothetical protein